jgi:hypothetical protein
MCLTLHYVTLHYDPALLLLTLHYCCCITDMCGMNETKSKKV